MPWGPRGTEDFGSWAARRQGVLAPHLDTHDAGSPRVGWDSFGPTSKWKRVLQTRSQSLPRPPFFPFFLYPVISAVLVQDLGKSQALLVVGIGPVCWKVTVGLGVCSQTPTLLPLPHLDFRFVIWRMVEVTPTVIRVPCEWHGNSRIRQSPIGS